MRALFVSVTCLFGVLVTPIPGVVAQTSLMEEVVVTAQKREENLQDVAVSVTAFSGDAIDGLGFETGYEIAVQTPNFDVSQFGRGHPIVLMNIRGVGNVDANPINDSSVSFYVDEVYQGATFAGSAQIFDVERVEILKGPQGTLFGRNATAGLVHYISRKPTDQWEGYASGQLGKFNERIIEGAFGGPVSEAISVRVAAKHQANDGIDDNPITGEDEFGKYEDTALRGTASIRVTESLEVLASVHHLKSQGNLRGHKFFGLLDPVTGDLCAFERVRNHECVDAIGMRFPKPDNTTTYAPATTSINHEIVGGYVNVTWSQPWGEVVSITGYENVDQTLDEPLGTSALFGPEQLFGGRTIARDNFSQELRVGNTFGSGKWVAGLYYYEDEAFLESPLSLGPSYSPDSLISLGRGEILTESYAVFGQIDYDLTRNLTLSVGARYTDETRDFDRFSGGTSVPFSYRNVGEFDAQEVTGKVALEWRPTESLLGYLQYARGYKSGGFAINGGGSLDPIGPADEEILDSYELGIKSSLFGDTVRLNGAVFYYDFDGLQASAGNLNNGVITSTFLNLDESRVVGADFEVVAIPVENLEIRLGAGFLDTEVSAAPNVIISGRSIDGNRLGHAPDYSINGIVRYAIPTSAWGTFTAQGDFMYTDEFHQSIANLEIQEQESYGVANFRLFWDSPDYRYHMQVFLENAFDEVYFPASYFDTSGFLSAGFGDVGVPRSWGVQFKVDI